MSKGVSGTQAQHAHRRHWVICSQCSQGVDGINYGAITAASEDGVDLSVHTSTENFVCMFRASGQEHPFFWNHLLDSAGQAWGHPASVGIEYDSVAFVGEGIRRHRQHG
jgi:hypothetical protein